jgi:uncharacterized protein YbjQ (UPF0145 family)
VNDTERYFGRYAMSKVRDNMRGSLNRTPEQLRDDAKYQLAQAREHEKAAQKLIDEATKLEDGRVVQVRFKENNRYSKSYAYRVPAGLTVDIGDFVKVTAFNTYAFEDKASILEVVGLGRQGYNGPLRDIDGKVQILRVDDDA